MTSKNAGAGTTRYHQILERIFFSHYTEGAHTVDFTREEMARVAAELGIELPKNLGDVVYSVRYRTPLPESIRATAPTDHEWIIRSTGRARYRFQIVSVMNITPSPMLLETKVPDATPGVIAMHAFKDEQALLAKVRYNHLIDILTGVTCYSLQNHLRTTVSGLGQVETDEVYVGIDRRGAHYAFPVQAKGKKDKIGIVQIEQDFALCAEKLPGLICRCIAAQFMNNGAIALFEFVQAEGRVALVGEAHYRLVPYDQMTQSDLDLYRSLSEEG